MTYYGAKDLAGAFRTVRKNTITVAEDIPDDKYSFQPAPGTRTVAQTLVHVALLTRVPLAIHKEHKLKNLAEFDFFKMLGYLTEEQEKSRTKTEILELLKAEGDKFASWLESVSDDLLGEQVAYPPEMQPPTKTRFEMIMASKEHEMHHRAQLMVVERMLGITPHLTRQMEAMRAQMMTARK